MLAVTVIGWPDPLAIMVGEIHTLPIVCVWLDVVAGSVLEDVIPDVSITGLDVDTTSGAGASDVCGCARKSHQLLISAVAVVSAIPIMAFVVIGI